MGYRVRAGIVTVASDAPRRASVAPIGQGPQMRNGFAELEVLNVGSLRYEIADAIVAIFNVATVERIS